MNFTSKEIRFIEQMVQYCGKKTATQCAIDSGFGVRGARTRASELMAKTEIRNEIELNYKINKIKKKKLRDLQKILKKSTLGFLRMVRNPAVLMIVIVIVHGYSKTKRLWNNVYGYVETT